MPGSRLDLEANVIDGGSGPDLRNNVQTIFQLQQYLSTCGEARLEVVQGIEYEALTPELLQRYLLLRSRVPTSDLQAGKVLALETHEGNFAKLRLLESVSPGAGSPIECEWTLYTKKFPALWGVPKEYSTDGLVAPLTFRGGDLNGFSTIYGGLAATYDQATGAWQFEPDKRQLTALRFWIPRDWDRTSPLALELSWSQEGDKPSTGNVVWTLQRTLFPYGRVKPVPMRLPAPPLQDRVSVGGFAGRVVSPAPSAGQHQIALIQIPFDDMRSTELGDGIRVNSSLRKLTYFRVSIARDADQAEDTLRVSARLHTVTLRYGRTQSPPVRQFETESSPEACD